MASPRFSVRHARGQERALAVMIDTSNSGWIDERWGRIVVAIGKGTAREEFMAILLELQQDSHEAGVEYEKVRRTREIANKLLGNKIICCKCGNAVDRPDWARPENDYTCYDCDPIPF